MHSYWNCYVTEGVGGGQNWFIVIKHIGGIGGLKKAVFSVTYLLNGPFVEKKVRFGIIIIDVFMRF